MTENTLLAYAEAAINMTFHNNSESGAKLCEVVQNIRHQPYEITAFFDDHGSKIYEHTSRDPKVCAVCLSNKWSESAHLMVHNHVINCPFSPEDLETGNAFDLQVNLVVTPDYNFYLFRPHTGWPTDDDWIKEYNLMIEMYQHHRRYSYDLGTARHLALLKLSKHHHMIYYVTNPEGERILSDVLEKAS